MMRLSIQRLSVLLLCIFAFSFTLFADGLPGEYYITQRWRDLLSRHSPATNPAFMTEENYMTVRGAFSPTLGNTFTLYEGGVTYPIGLYQSVGFSVLGVNSQEDIKKTIFENGTITETGETFQDNHQHFMASYAINPWNKLSVGANLIYYRIPNFGDEIQGIALDAGVSYRITNNPVLGEHIAGLSFQNALSPDFEFKELQQQSINAKLSWMAKLWDGKIDAGIDLDFKDFTSLDQYYDADFDPSTGKATLTPKDGALEFDFNSRVGVWLMQMVNVYGLVGNDYIGVAGGMNVPTVFGGRDFEANYQYISMYEDDDAFIHTVYLRSELGMHREQKYARRMAEKHKVNVGDLWRRAMRNYSSGNFWDAMFIFGRLNVEYPDFPKNHLATYYIGRCQEEMEMRGFATENYHRVKSEYPASTNANNLAKLGLLRLNYREDVPSEVASLHSELSAPNVADSIRHEANYYMGEQEMQNDNLQKAIQLFSKVPSTHKDYMFAQHSMSVAYARQNQFDKTKLHLDNVIQTPYTTNTGTYLGERTKELQESIKNRAYALLGYYYFNQKQYQAAMASLSEVDSDSEYFLDALIGKAWCAFKVQNWSDCKDFATELMNETDNAVLQAEAGVMLGYYHIINKQYNEAVKVLEPISNRLATYSPPTDTVLEQKKNEYYEHRTEYFNVAEKANSLALTTYNSYVENQKDSLKNIKDEYEKKVRAYDKAVDERKRTAFFGRSPKTMEQVINYALGKAEEQSTVSEDAEDANEDIEDLESEEEKLLRQLEQME
ncbi:MAG: hypothetical protein ACQEQV_02345 [Fibrobacterota bacterium]